MQGKEVSFGKNRLLLQINKVHTETLHRQLKQTWTLFHVTFSQGQYVTMTTLTVSDFLSNSLNRINFEVSFLFTFEFPSPSSV